MKFNQSELLEIINLINQINQSFDFPSNSCLYSSSLLTAVINDHLPYEAKLIVGSLSINGALVFQHTPILPLLKNNIDLQLSWDGHAWIEIFDLIIDLSITNSIFSSNKHNNFQQHIINQFHKIPDYLIGQKNLLLDKGFNYIAKEKLTNHEIDLFIKNLDNILNE